MVYYSEGDTILWEETNAGFGQLLLLLNYLICKHGPVGPDDTVFRPQGSFSQVIVGFGNDETLCEIWGPPKNQNRFNIGLLSIADFVKCLGDKLFKIIQNKEAKLRQTNTYDKRSNNGISDVKASLIYDVEDGKIGGKHDIRSVSYTHLTLPTICSV